MPFIEINRRWVDDDEMLQLDVKASNDVQVGKQDFYTYPEDLAEFGKSLQTFPKNVNDEVKIEYGTDPSYYCHFSLAAFVLDGVGHSAIELKFDNRLEPPLKAQIHFCMACDPTNINELGNKLASWAVDTKELFRYEW